jgi:hypothetical protein
MSEMKKIAEKPGNGKFRIFLNQCAVGLGFARRIFAGARAFAAPRLKAGVFPIRFAVLLTRLAVVIMIALIGLRGLKNVKLFKGIAKHVTPVTSQESNKPVGERRMSVKFEFDGVKSKWGYSGWAQDGSANPNLDKGIWGETLSIHGTLFEKGIGTHAPSVIVFDLQGAKKPVTKFTCKVGVDGKAGAVASVAFKVWGDDQKLFESPLMRENENALPVQVILSGHKELKLEAAPGDPSASWDHADWVDIKFE